MISVRSFSATAVVAALTFAVTPSAMASVGSLAPGPASPAGTQAAAQTNVQQIPGMELPTPATDEFLCASTNNHAWLD